jgi:hypothetical protein
VGKAIRITGVSLALVATVGVLTACGSDALSGDVVAQVGASVITKPELNHWMSTLAGGDFYEIALGHPLPRGLVSEPPNYDACATRLRAVAQSANSDAANTALAAPEQSQAQLKTKCRQLYLAIRLQAITYLVESHWILETAATGAGVTPTNAEVNAMLKQIKTNEYPRNGQFQRYLANSSRSLADELLVVRMDVVSRKLEQKVSDEGRQARLKLAEAGEKVTARTNCRMGYVVPHCRQFRTTKTTTSSPAVLLEQVAALAGIRCVSRALCG